MGHQIKHIRTSVRGKKFWAGSRTEVEEPEEEINVLDTKTDIEIPAEDIKKIKEQTDRSEDDIIDKAVELDTNSPEEIIQALKEENPDDYEE